MCPQKQPPVISSVDTVIALGKLLELPDWVSIDQVDGA
jgi:hypothetical protein